MVRTVKTSLPQKFGINPWLVILLTAPIPFLALGYFTIKWYQENSNLTKTNRYFVQRQNTVLAYDAMEVSSGISDLLEKAARDLKVMSLLPPTVSEYQAFYRAQMSDYTQFYTENEPPKSIPLPFFNQQMILSLSGKVLLHLWDGEPQKHFTSLESCQTKDLCDRELLNKAMTLKVGEYWYGRVMRYYSAEGKREDTERSSLNVVYRGTNAIYLLGIDFRHLKDHLTTPVFPYEAKRNLLQAYAQGNYIYIVDSNHAIIAHPKYWHQAGIDRVSGEYVAPMKTDDDEGKHPLNIAAYQGERLKSYFDRLLRKSFLQKGVDVFQAPNLGGVNRVVAVAPIYLSKGQFEKSSGVFGYAIMGCSVEYFEEPTEKLIPYY